MIFLYTLTIIIILSPIIFAFFYFIDQYGLEEKKISLKVLDKTYIPQTTKKNIVASASSYIDQTEIVKEKYILSVDLFGKTQFIYVDKHNYNNVIVGQNYSFFIKESRVFKKKTIFLKKE